MLHVRIFTKEGCPYSEGAKRLLHERGIRYEEIDVTGASERREDMLRETGGRGTTPQIFFGHRHIGGYDQLLALDRNEGVRAALGQADQPPA